MNRKNRLRVAVAVSLFTLLAFGTTVTLVMMPTEAGSETRCSALLFGLAGHGPATYQDAVEAAWHILTLHYLDALYLVDREAAVPFLVSEQNQSTGGFPHHLYPNIKELYYAALAVRALEVLGGLNRINTTMLVQFVLEHYNASTGAFYEPDDECWFPLQFKTLNPAYGRDNMISTYLGVSLLEDLDTLDSINTTRTLAWIWGCQTAFGFRPQQSQIEPNYFIVDDYGTGLAYTMAAVEILTTLGALSQLSPAAREDINLYAWMCQSPDGDFSLIPGDWLYTDLRYGCYGVMLLGRLGGLDSKKDGLKLLLDAAFRQQDLRFQRKLLPDLLWQLYGFRSAFFLARTNTYGLFDAGYYQRDTYMAVRLMHISDSLSALQVATPRAALAWQFVLGAAIWMAAIIAGTIVLYVIRVKREIAILWAVTLAISLLIAVLSVSF